MPVKDVAWHYSVATIRVITMIRGVLTLWIAAWKLDQKAWERNNRAAIRDCMRAKGGFKKERYREAQAPRGPGKSRGCRALLCTWSYDVQSSGMLHDTTPQRRYPLTYRHSKPTRDPLHDRGYDAISRKHWVCIPYSIIQVLHDTSDMYADTGSRARPGSIRLQDKHRARNWWSSGWLVARYHYWITSSRIGANREQARLLSAQFGRNWKSFVTPTVDTCNISLICKTFFHTIFGWYGPIRPSGTT
jgi:hypothetical protein